MITKILASFLAIYQATSATNRALLQQAPVQILPFPVQPNHPIHPTTTTTTTTTAAPITTLPPPPTQPPITTTMPPTTTTTTLPPPPTTTTTAAPITLPPMDGYAYGAHNQLCPEYALTYSQCPTNTDSVSNSFSNHIRCGRDSECCMCASIQCGTGVDDVPCKSVWFGDSGAYGVRDIQVTGKAGFGYPGAVIDCQGLESCRGSLIRGRNIEHVNCQGPKSCEGAHITVIDPKHGFSLNCQGMGACNGLTIDIELSGPPPGYMCRQVFLKDVFEFGAINCNNEAACEGMHMTVDNKGCDHLLLGTVRCNQEQSCTNAVFDLIGDIDIFECECGPSCANTQGLGKCFQNLAFMLCPDAGSCMGISKDIINPMNDFELKCGDVDSCRDANFLLTFDNSLSKPEPIWSIKGLKLSGTNSGRNAVFTIANTQVNPATGMEMELLIERLECNGFHSCVDTTFVIGENVVIGEMLCAMEACEGCLVKPYIEHAGVPCDRNQVSAPSTTTTTTTTSTTTTTTTTRPPRVVTTRSKFVPIGYVEPEPVRPVVPQYTHATTTTAAPVTLQPRPGVPQYMPV